MKTIDKNLAIALIIALVISFMGILPSIAEIIILYAIIITAVIYITGRLFFWGREKE